jgi:hypothetical protein
MVIARARLTRRPALLCAAGAGYLRALDATAPVQIGLIGVYDASAKWQDVEADIASFMGPAM